MNFIIQYDKDKLIAFLHRYYEVMKRPLILMMFMMVIGCLSLGSIFYFGGSGDSPSSRGFATIWFLMAIVCAIAWMSLLQIMKRRIRKAIEDINKFAPDSLSLDNGIVQLHSWSLDRMKNMMIFSSKVNRISTIDIRLAVNLIQITSENQLSDKFLILSWIQGNQEYPRFVWIHQDWFSEPIEKISDELMRNKVHVVTAWQLSKRGKLYEDLERIRKNERPYMLEKIQDHIPGIVYTTENYWKKE